MDTSASSAASLTSRSTDSMEIDTLSTAAHSPPRTSGSTNNTPFTEHHKDSFIPMSADADKGIVVEAPLIDMTGARAALHPFGPEDEYEDDEGDVVVNPQNKRKRTSVNYILDDSNYVKSPRVSPPDEPRVKRRIGPRIRGVIIGVWRDSDQPDDEEKHVIFGFIDIHDRLRTRIYSMNRRGEELIGNAPTGAGGCWVTFERVIFEPHLRNLSAAQIKEYVKIRSDTEPEATPELRLEAEQKTVLRAIAIAADDKGDATPTTKPSVGRRSLGRSNSHRESLPRQSLHKAPSFQAVNAASLPTPKASPSHEGKPIGVLLGYWVDSSEPRPEDKHAVYGVLSETDCFRVKVQRVTRDGRYVDGNFPVGAGALWLHYDKVVFDPHLTSLSRVEMKEYCRLRQKDLEKGETDTERKSNELKAAQGAKAVVAAANGATNGYERPSTRNASPELEVRHSARSEQKLAARQQAEAEAAAALRIRQEKAEARERQHEKTRKEVAIAEAVIQEAAQQELKNNLKKLNKVWVAQQATINGHSNGGSPAPQAQQMHQQVQQQTPPVVENEVKYHNGIKYERKMGAGPFQGKLVSSAQILSIDGEDYVEYRVLTKPSFF